MNQPVPMHHFHPPGCCCPACQPPCPPPPCCPPPSCVDQARACYDMSQGLYDLVKKVLLDVIASEPGLLTPTGVTDGSDVQPGQVGEFKEFVVDFNIPTTFNFHQVVAVGTLPAGDWDVEARIWFGTLLGGCEAYLDPQQPGFSNNMQAILGVWVTAGQAGMQEVILTTPMARANITAPTLVSFTVITNYLESPVLPPEASTGSILFVARRMR